MPIPEGGAWPPVAHAEAYRAYRDWDAWYVGEPDKLRAVFAGRGMAAQGFDRPDRLSRLRGSGGVIGSVSRWLWGAAPSGTASDNRLHVPVAADLASAIGALIYSEPPRVTGDQQEVIDRIVTAGLIPALRHGAEANSVLGDIYLRPVIDREVSPDGAIPTVVHADSAIPVIRFDKLVEVTFWSEIGRDTRRVYRLLEHHETGRITYRVYQGDAEELGISVGLAMMPEALTAAVDSDGVQLTGLDRLDVIRVPNCGPQRRWRKHTALKYHGRSDYDGNEQVFDQIDQVWTSWMRDIRLGSGRITVPEYMLEGQGVGKGALWDSEREIYSAIRASPDDAAGLTVSQFAIRHEAHKATLDELFRAAMRHAGISAQTMGEQGGDAAMTATEVQAKERLSFVTRGDRTGTAADAIEEYLTVHTMLEMVHGIGGVTSPLEDISVEFGDSVSESPETVARTLQLLVAADAVSHEMRVRTVHPEWDDEQVLAEVAKIQNAQPPVENPDTFTGAPPEDMPE